MPEYTVYPLSSQWKLEDDYKDPDMLPKINKSDFAGMMEAIEEYLRSGHGVLRVPLASVIRNATKV